MRISLAFLLLFLVACGGKGKPPSGPLDREKFEEVLMESMLIEARLSQELTVDKRVDGPASAYYDEMFKKQGVTKADFRATYDAYLKQPEVLKSVYQDVLNDLQQRADSVAH
ncbi:MAG: DUF4296 domain-containing protein [Flavobacteriales bacterium]|jgi:hypothetical protein|nr:DUF4296 domain-containing protein [Flavobacteriales bacterium]MBK6893220.1 DUF4296 domain-containing protein [Flavobacteriales bacterium]MBK7249047.1 DUF4296 domain-containing protein [Flavobacteriales bacterium]MBK7285620.1 DUF4296 domain-containing protein [Flavobacteriales bacterium]MBK9058708.1 DUF4296 domain-containing protein [Flavobacteriales bacterium]